MYKLGDRVIYPSWYSAQVISLYLRDMPHIPQQVDPAAAKCVLLRQGTDRQTRRVVSRVAD